MRGMGWAALAAGLWLAGAAAAQDALRLGTGSERLTYAPVGRIIAEAVSEAGLAVEDVPSRGSLDNVRAIAEGRRELGLAQSDVAYWAHVGSGIWSGRPPAAGLRTVAALYPEHIHLVARADGGIETLADLRDRRISLDEVGSGTHVDARLILEAAGLRSDQYAVEELDGRAAAAALEAGTIDAFFLVAGYPTAAVADLAARLPIRLVPIDGDVALELVWLHGFLERSEVPEGTYPGVAGVETVSLGAQLLTRADVPEAVVHAVAAALFSDATLARLAAGHPKGAEIGPATALDGVAVPLHPGAVRFYEESGVMD